MLSESEIKRAKELIFEYQQWNKDIRKIQDKIESFTDKAEIKQGMQDIADIKQCQKVIEITFQKEFGVDLQEMGKTDEKGITKTPLHIIHEIKKQAKEQELTIPSKTQDSTDRPREMEKLPLADQGSYKTEQERHHLEHPKTPEIEQIPQAPDQTFTVTHHIAESQQHRQFDFEDRYKPPKQPEFEQAKQAPDRSSSQKVPFEDRYKTPPDHMRQQRPTRGQDKEK